jgi:hypothetical protein
MSWWNDGDDMVGDGPADRLTEAWRVILGARRRARRRKPTLAQTLEAFAAAMRSAELERPSRGIAVRKGSQEAGVFEGASAEADLSEPFSAAIARISQEYQQRFKRPPRPSELVKAMAFVLGYETGTYLSDASAWPMAEVQLRAA